MKDVDDLLDPEVFARYNRLRQRATGIAVGSGFAVAAGVFWAVAYLTRSELELPLAGAATAGAIVAGVLWWRLAPKKLSIDLTTPEEPDEAALAALSAGFVAPSDDGGIPVATHVVTDEELAATVGAARAEQSAALMRNLGPPVAGLGTFGLSFYVLGIQLALDSGAIVLSIVPAMVVALFVHSKLSARSDAAPLDLEQLSETLRIADQIDVVRDNDLLAILAGRLGVSLPRRHDIRSGGGYLASVGPSPESLLVRLAGLVPLLERTAVTVDEVGRPELIATGGWRLALPLLPERLQVDDAKGRKIGFVARPFGLLRYHLLDGEGAIRVKLERSGLSLSFEARDPDGASVGGLEVFRPSFFRRWFFGPFAGERGVRVRFTPVLDEDMRRLLLVAAVHFDRSI